MSEEFALPNFDTDLNGEVALVTGTTSGLGRRFALVLARCGAKVALTGRRVERLDELAREIEAFGGECVSVRLDTRDAQNLVDAVDEVEKALGTVTILVNNAGIPDAQRAHKMSLELIDSVFDTNLRGPYILSCEVARRLIAAEKPGRMVNISSIGGYNYSGNGAALYSITKSGIARMTECLAVEWARFNINVNGIAPGAFKSEMMDGMMERLGDFSGSFPRKRVCDPAQLDSTLLYLCAPSSECVTGTVIKVDDGQGAR
ncbi:MAG: SDR family NAD(P)-dependent oxidoreductase [Gammaproteobacteria bacterium]|nr:SDR family NAD(P)-dependent oxidoreductase [Gammaproteobacteria bacterium]